MLPLGRRETLPQAIAPVQARSRASIVRSPRLRRGDRGLPPRKSWACSGDADTVVRLNYTARIVLVLAFFLGRDASALHAHLGAAVSGPLCRPRRALGGARSLFSGEPPPLPP